MRREVSLISAEPRWARWIAAGLGAGFLPFAPGTWGSLAAGLLALPWVLHGKGPALLLGAVLCTLLGLAVLRRVDAARLDAAWIVVDEAAGAWLALGIAVVAGGPGWPAWWLALVLFRALDIAKPWPVSALERRGPPAWRVMADDLAAGLLAGLAAAFVLRALA